MLSSLYQQQVNKSSSELHPEIYKMTTSIKLRPAFTTNVATSLRTDGKNCHCTFNELFRFVLV